MDRLEAILPVEKFYRLAKTKISPLSIFQCIDACHRSCIPKVFELVEKGDSLREKLQKNARFFREKMEKLGFQLLPGEHPIIPVMLGDAALASRFAKEMLEEGVYVIGFSFPVVPMGKARIRTQMSAAHTEQDLEKAINAFAKVGKNLGVIR